MESIVVNLLNIIFANLEPKEFLHYSEFLDKQYCRKFDLFQQIVGGWAGDPGTRKFNQRVYSMLETALIQKFKSSGIEAYSDNKIGFIFTTKNNEQVCFYLHDWSIEYYHN